MTNIPTGPYIFPMSPFGGATDWNFNKWTRLWPLYTILCCWLDEQSVSLTHLWIHECFQDQILHTNCTENEGSWNGSSPTRPRILHQILFYYHTLVTASLLFHKKDIFHRFFFSSFRGRFRMGCRRKNISMLKFGFWRERRRPHTHAPSFVDVAVARKMSGA